MFLIIGYHDEPTINYFLDYLERKYPSLPYDFLDLSLLGDDGVKVCFGNDLMIDTPNKTFDFTDYHAIYARCFIINDPEKYSSKLKTMINLINSYLDAADKLVVNRPSAGASNYSKLLHVNKLADFGFNVPKTIIFGSPELVKRSIPPDGTWINKGISSIRTRACAYDHSHYANIDLLRQVPSLFQRKADGFDVRIHIVGDEAVALKITSDEIDYRYHRAENRYEEIDVPEILLKQCFAYCTQEELLFAGIDFKVNGSEWCLLEVNPMPGYNFFDKKSDGKISAALVRLLQKVDLPLKDYRYALDRPFINKSRRTMS